MTILDRFIARQFVINVIALLAILCSFVVVVDVSVNASRFASAAAELARTAEGQEAGLVRRALVTVMVVFDLWWPRLLQLFNFLLGLVMVAAMGFTCTQLTRSREVVAMLSAGIGLHRVARPMLIAAVGLSTLQVLNQELVIPRIAPLLPRDHGDAGTRGLSAAAVPLTPDAGGRLFRAASFDPQTAVLKDLYVLERDQSGRAVAAVRAESAVWRDGGWDLTGGTRTLRNTSNSSGRRSEPAPRLETGLGPEELTMNRYRAFRQALSFRQAGKLLERPELLDADSRNRLERIRWGRVSVVASNLLSLVIAMPFFLTREPRPMAAQALKCAPISIVALMGGVLGASAAIPGLPPAVGVFIPVMILTVVAIAMVSSVRS